MPRHELARDAAERLLDCAELVEDLGAMPPILDHALYAAHLPLDPPEPRLRARTPCPAGIARKRAGAPRRRGRPGRAAVGRPRGVGAGDGARLASAWTRGDGRPCAPPRERLASRRAHSRTRASRRLDATTLTELAAIAALASAGESRTPKLGYSTPAAIGIATTL